MSELILFEKSVPYIKVKEAFQKVIDEYLPSASFELEGESEAWKKFLSFFLEHKGSYITDRVSNVYQKGVNTYLEFIAVPNRSFLHLYDGNERVQRDVRIYDEYPIKGLFIVPEMKDVDQDPGKPYTAEVGLANFIKKFVDACWCIKQF